MPRRHWLPHPFFGVGLILAALVGGASLYDQHENPKCGDGAAARECQRTEPEIPVQPTVKPPPSDPEARKAEREESDLEAQWEQARAAYIAAGVALFGAFVTLAGVIYVARTLELNKSAVAEARKGAAAAAAAAEAMAKIERAYLFATVEYNGSHGVEDLVRISVTVDFSNHGKTPAILRKFRAITYAAGLNTNPTMGAIGEVTIPPGLVVGAGKSHPLNMNRLITKDDFANIKHANMKLFCVGLVEYDTVVIKDRRTVFCWEYLALRGRFEISPNHELNDYT